MNRPCSQLMSPAKLRRFCIAGGLTALLSGCLPIPHTTARSQEVEGKVLDAQTRAPICRAEVALNESPHHATYTDEKGHFQLKATRNLHLLAIAPEGHWPNRKDSTIKISHPDYSPVWGDWSGNAGDILLKRKPHED